jgi:hypothetical protein
MAHQTIRELENETLGLDLYVRYLSGLFDEEGLSAYYVDSRAYEVNYDGGAEARSLSPHSLDIFAELQSWLGGSGGKPIAVLGGYGAGKSSLAKRLVSAQAKAALADPFARRPILIKLGSLSRYASIEGLLGALFTHEFPVNGFNTLTFLELNKKGRLLIVLDGFDEMKHAMSWTDFRNQVADLNRFVQPESRVVLLGRPSAFTSADEHLHVLRGLKRLGEGFRKLVDWPEFREFELAEFTTEERARFIETYLRFRAPGQSPDWIQSRIAEVGLLTDADPEIFGKPVHSKILVEMASDPTVDLKRFSKGITRWGLYDVFFTELAERETKKEARAPIDENSRIEFLRDVAYWLWTTQSGSVSFSAADLPDELIQNLPLGGAPDIDSAKREYLTGSFLEKKSGDVYYFGHRSFAEYLVADRMVSKEPAPNEQSTYSALARDGVLLFLREAPSADAFRRWALLLPQATGEINLEYIQFLGEAVGGKQRLIELTNQSTVWPEIIDVFDEDMGLSGDLRGKVGRKMAKADNTLFFLLLSFLQYLSPRVSDKPEALAVTVAAALLERLFTHAELDENSRKAVVADEGNEARVLAQRTIVGLKHSMGDRRLILKGQTLLKSKADDLRVAGLDVKFQPPSMLMSFADDMQLPWSAVLSQMSERARVKARTYFQRSDTLNDVFTRSKPLPTRRNSLRQ